MQSPYRRAEGGSSLPSAPPRPDRAPTAAGQAGPVSQALAAGSRRCQRGGRALAIISSNIFSSPQVRAQIASLALAHTLPAITTDTEPPHAGGLMAYGVNRPDNLRRAATYVDKILRGAKPADLPVEQATTFDFAVNLKTAQTLRLTIPQSVLQQATEIIQ